MGLPDGRRLQESTRIRCQEKETEEEVKIGIGIACIGIEKRRRARKEKVYKAEERGGEGLERGRRETEEEKVVEKRARRTM